MTNSYIIVNLINIFILLFIYCVSILSKKFINMKGYEMRNFIVNGITDAILSIIPALIITLVVELFKNFFIKKK